MKNCFSTLFLALLLLVSVQLLAQVPKLNSYPSAQATIFLDFDGQKVSGTSWNVRGTLYCAPSNMDDAQITEVFNRVAEDYRPFNINVTTDSTKYFAAPVRQRMRVILTTSSDWYGRAGGVAYINSFSWGDNTPCFVFTELLGYDAKWVAEATTHEAGHTLGLRHQSRYDNICQKTEEYNSGQGSGEIGWAPIMGVGYYRNQTTWHNGPNPYGCNNAQDDLAIITNSTNGFGFRTDEHEATTRRATVNTFTDGRFTNEGVINNSVDEDMFEFALTTDGQFKLDVRPFNVGNGDAGSNLDVKVKLYNSRQNLIDTYDNPESLSASIDTTLSSGTYYFVVSGTSNAYTAQYASIGAYTVEASYGSFTVLPVRKLELRGVADGTAHKLTWAIDADEVVKKQVLEVSANGSSFQPIGQVAITSRSFQYVPASSSALQYRVNVSFENGRQYYSNIIALRNNLNTTKPQLFTNIIRNGSIIVNSPAVYNYTITDYSGRALVKGVLTQGAATISTGNITNGSYILVFSNGKDQYVEKFIKQ